MPYAGQPLTGTLLDYAIPKAATIPALLLETMETRSADQPPWRQRHR
jgi:hypothetical protein